MPYLVTVAAQLDGTRPPAFDHLHALVCRWVEGDESAAHNANIKSFRLGLPLWTPDGTTYLRIGLLDDAAIGQFANRVARSARDIRLGHQCGVLVTAPDGGVDAEVTEVGWTDLLDAAVPTPQYRFEFRSPTVFRSGSRDVPFPNPGSIFGHLRKRWTVFAPDELSPDIDFAWCGLQLESFDGGTLTHRVKGREVSGFVGAVSIVATDGSSDQHRSLDALARLAPFSGVGSHTTKGMGDAVYVEPRIGA